MTRMSSCLLFLACCFLLFEMCYVRTLYDIFYILYDVRHFQNCRQWHHYLEGEGIGNASSTFHIFPGLSHLLKAIKA